MWTSQTLCRPSCCSKFVRFYYTVLKILDFCNSVFTLTVCNTTNSCSGHKRRIYPTYRVIFKLVWGIDQCVLQDVGSTKNVSSPPSSCIVDKAAATSSSLILQPVIKRGVSLFWNSLGKLVCLQNIFLYLPLFKLLCWGFSPFRRTNCHLDIDNLYYLAKNEIIWCKCEYSLLLFS